MPNALYAVEIYGETTGDKVFAMNIEGRAFEDNYTVYLLLAAGTLGSGKYVVKITAPDESVVFRSSLEVK